MTSAVAAAKPVEAGAVIDGFAPEADAATSATIVVLAAERRS